MSRPPVTAAQQYDTVNIDKVVSAPSQVLHPRMAEKPQLLITRKLPAAVEARAQRDYHARLNATDEPYGREELIRAADGSSAILCTTTDRLDAATIARLPGGVQMLATFSVGFEHIDLTAARSRAMIVTNTPDVLTDATADVAMLLILGAARRASEGERLIRDDAWTVQQRFRLRLVYEDTDPVELSSTLVSWESKDGLRYRFNERRLRNGQADEEVRGEARLDGSGKGGKADFTKPDSTSLTLAPNVLFPTAHTLLLIERAAAGDNFLSRDVFDGATEDNASQISAVIGPRIDSAATGDKGAADNKDDKTAAGNKGNKDDKTAAGKKDNKVVKSALIERPSWRVRLAFFPADTKSDEPDYELGMRLFDNGVSGDMSLDYSDYVIRAKLDEIEPLSKPAC